MKVQQKARILGTQIIFVRDARRVAVFTRREKQ
jgi:hypothetical protein